MPDDDLVRRACPLIHRYGSAHFLAPETLARGIELGMSPPTIRFNVVGRAGALGDVDYLVAATALGFFNPEYIQPMWESARAVVPPSEVAAAHFACAAATGRSRLDHIERLEEFCAAGRAVYDAADITGIPLWAGFKAMGLVDDAPGQAVQLITALRQMRGSLFILAIRACGLDAKTAHFTQRPHYVREFGWSTEDPPEVGPAQHEAMAAAESLTDDMIRPAFSVLDEKAADALVTGVVNVGEALIAAGWGGPGHGWTAA